MFSFPSLTRDSLNDEHKALWDRSVERRGEARFIGAAAQAPELLAWYGDEFYARVFYGGRVPVRFKELGRLRLSTLHGCRSCNRGNRLDAADAGLSEHQIAAIDNPSDAAFDDADRAVLELAERIAMTSPHGSLDAELYGALREHFDDAQIFELGFAFGLLAGMAKFLFVFDIAEKEEYCPFGPEPT